MATKVLNIDEIQQETLFSIVVGGKTHDMVAPTLDHFIANLKDLEALAAAPNVVAETEATIRMIVRAFPTLTEEDVKKWPLGAVEKLFAVIRGVDGEVEVAEADAEGNAAAES